MLNQIPQHLSFALWGKTKRKTKKDQTKVKPQTKRKAWTRHTYFSMDPSNNSKYPTQEKTLAQAVSQSNRDLIQTCRGH